MKSSPFTAVFDACVLYPAPLRDFLMWLSTGHEPLIDSLTLPDPDDRHVLAAAVRCNASVIITFNERDFPAERLATFGIEAQHPDEFIDNLFDLDQAAVVTTAQKQRSSLRNPTIDADRYLETLLKQGLPRTVKDLDGFRSVL